MKESHKNSKSYEFYIIYFVTATCAVVYNVEGRPLVFVVFIMKICKVNFAFFFDYQLFKTTYFKLLLICPYSFSYFSR